MSVAISAPFARLRRRSISSSVTPVPPATSLSRSPRCISHVERISGRSARTSSRRAEWSPDSVMQATAPESVRIHAICDGELVS
jgi:hypothetical protein